jgi:hypothetical protein
MGGADRLALYSFAILRPRHRRRAFTRRRDTHSGAAYVFKPEPIVSDLKAHPPERRLSVRALSEILHVSIA